MYTLFTMHVNKKEGKDQVSIQSSTTPDLGNTGNTDPGIIGNTIYS